MRRGIASATTRREWNYYILGTAIVVALLAGIAYYAWTWPKTTKTPATALRDERASHLVSPWPHPMEDEDQGSTKELRRAG